MNKDKLCMEDLDKVSGGTGTADRNMRVSYPVECPNCGAKALIDYSRLKNICTTCGYRFDDRYREDSY